MKNLIVLLVFGFFNPVFSQNWYEEDDAEGITFILIRGTDVKFSGQEDAAAYENEKDLGIGFSKTTYRLHGHSVIYKGLLLRHSETQANYGVGFKKREMTAVEGFIAGEVGIGHVLTASVMGGIYLGVPISYKGENTGTFLSYNNTYERPFIYQGFLVGGGAGLKLGKFVANYQAQLNIPFIVIRRKQPEEVQESNKPLNLRPSTFGLNITIQRKG